MFRSLSSLLKDRERLIWLKDLAVVVGLVLILFVVIGIVVQERVRAASLNPLESRTEVLQPSGATVTAQLNGQFILRSMGTPRLQRAIDDFLTKYPDYAIVAVSINESPAQELVVFSPQPATAVAE